MATSRISGIYLKIERAKKHIADLDVAIRAFCESKPYTIATKPHPIAEIQHTTLYVSRVEPVPEDIGLIAGDVIHNLRSSLDHLAWQLIEANGGTPGKGTYFPISESAEKYAAAIKRGVVDGMSVGAQKLIADSQRHASGDNTLWFIHELDIVDKHRLLITAVSSMDSWGVEAFVGDTMWFKEGMFFPLEVGYEIVNIPTSTYKRERHENFKLGIDVAFGKPEIAEGHLVLLALTKAADFVSGFVRQFEGFLV